MSGWTREEELTPKTRRCLSKPRRIAVALRAEIILRPKNLETCHFLVHFCTYCESEAKEKRIHKGITKADGPCNNVARRQLKRAAQYDKALEKSSEEIQGAEMNGDGQVE